MLQMSSKKLNQHLGLAYFTVLKTTQNYELNTIVERCTSIKGCFYSKNTFIMSLMSFIIVEKVINHTLRMTLTTLAITK